MSIIAALSSIIAAIVVFYWAVLIGVFGALPGKAELMAVQNSTSSEVYSADSVLIGKYFIHDRTNASFEEISPNMLNALVATEDVRFYEHNGVDKKSLLRVLIKTLLLQDESAGGGSTITQQLVKNLYPRKNFGFLSIPVNKFKEAIVARRLEKIYTKEDIITLYLNTVPFGENAFGIETAAERYFNTSSEKLNVQEAAVLVGMLKATTTYNPVANPERSVGRRNTVLSQMAKYNYLTAEEADSIKTLPIKLDYTYLTHNEGLATYFRAHLKQDLLAWCNKNTNLDGSNYNLYTDGLKIYTTIDSKMQAYAEEAMREHMASLQKSFNAHWKGRRPWYKDQRTLINAIYKSPRYKQLKAEGLSEKEIQEVFKKPVKMKIFTWEGEQEKMMSPLDSVKHYLYFLNAGFMAMEPDQGFIRAWVGGINHKYFKYDHVNIGTKRQVGSTFKPFVYAAALEQGAPPCTYISAEREVYEELDNWAPANSDDNYEGKYSLEGALTNSVNTISVKVLKKTGINNTLNLAHSMGIQSKLPKVPSIALGTPAISLYEMVSAYCTFANRGVTTQPVYLLRIEDKNGNVLQEFQQEQPKKKVLSKENADIMIHMLKNVVNNGTGARLRHTYGLKNDIAGKTGTTQSHADGWFMGVTPELVAGVWVGANDPRIHFRTIQLGQGANTALPIFAKFMQKINKDPEFEAIEKARFPTPSPEVLARLDCDPYKEDKGFFDFLTNIGKDKEKEFRKSPDKKEQPRRVQKKEKGKKNIFDKIGDLFGN